METPRPPGVGSAISLRLVSVLVVGLALVVGMVYAWRNAGNSATPAELRIATGPEGGFYRVLGARLADLLETHGVVTSAVATPTAGSRANADLLRDRGTDLALVQSDTPLPEGVRLVAELYDETLHALVAAPLVERVRCFSDLADLRVSLGPLGSGTRQIVDRLLAHLDARVGEAVDVGNRDLANAFATGQVDVAFVLTAMPSEVVSSAVREGGARLLSLEPPDEGVGLADALSICFPAYREIVIPRGTYGRETSQSAVTIGVGAWLVAREAIPAATIRAVARTLFENRIAATGDTRRSTPRIVERYTPDRVDLPYHAGAVAWFIRDEPPFVVAYAEAISLGLTLLVGAFSAGMAIREWLRRQRKNRIDAYYNEIRAHSDEIDGAPPMRLRALRSELDAIRQRAFDDLVAERIDADSSFIIFQDYLRGELESIDQRLARPVTAPAAGSPAGGT